MSFEFNPTISVGYIVASVLIIQVLLFQIIGLLKDILKVLRERR